jgi:flagellar M-ring protein FliF
MVAGEARPLEKTVRTTRVPEGRIQRINAIVVLGFDASANEIGRARQMAHQALGLQPERGDRLSVYALPAATPKPQAGPPVAAPPAPLRIPKVQAASPSPDKANPKPLNWAPWMLAAAAAILILFAAIGRLRRRPPADEIEVEDFDASLDVVRNQVLADPRVAADVIKLWMRA